MENLEGQKKKLQMKQAWESQTMHAKLRVNNED